MSCISVLKLTRCLLLTPYVVLASFISTRAKPFFCAIQTRKKGKTAINTYNLKLKLSLYILSYKEEEEVGLYNFM